MSENLTFEYPLQILEKHLDTFGHVNNATYLELYEEARWDFIARRGYGLEKIRATGLGPVILELHLRFRRELTLRRNVKIKTQLVSYNGKIGELKQWIENDSGELCSDLEMKMGLFDTRARKLVEPTKEWLDAIGWSA